MSRVVSSYLKSLEVEPEEPTSPSDVTENFSSPPSNTRQPPYASLLIDNPFALYD